MYYVEKTIEIAGSHHLDLSYDSPCGNVHGHNWIITVFLKSEELNEDGMILDFKFIKDHIHQEIDHKNLNDVLEMNPTAENLARWVVDMIPFCYKATVIESQNNKATYEVT